jgi:hypothetical protein
MYPAANTPPDLVRCAYVDARPLYGTFYAFMQVTTVGLSTYPRYGRAPLLRCAGLCTACPWPTSPTPHTRPTWWAIWRTTRRYTHDVGYLLICGQPAHMHLQCVAMSILGVLHQNWVLTL